MAYKVCVGCFLIDESEEISGCLECVTSKSKLLVPVIEFKGEVKEVEKELNKLVELCVRSMS